MLQKINFYVDLQYRYVGYTATGVDDALVNYTFAKQWHFFNPKAGILYKVKPQHHLYVSYAMGNREPNRDDVLAALSQSKTVKPETMHDVEAGYKGIFTSGIVTSTLNLNYYLMQYEDQLVLTGKLNDVGNPIKENVPVSYRTGVELSGGIHFNHRWGTAEREYSRKIFSINYSFAYSVNKIKSFDEYIYTYDDNYVAIDSLTQIIKHKNSNISFSPNIVASLEVVAYPVSGLEISLMNKAVSKQYLDNTQNETRKLGDYCTQDLRIAYQLLHKKHFSIKLSDHTIYNILHHNKITRKRLKNKYYPEKKKIKNQLES